jgi:hypothetical protein
MEREANKVSFEAVKTEKVICVETTDGTGTEADPVRRSKRYWTVDGYFIGQVVLGASPLTNPNASWNANSESKK